MKLLLPTFLLSTMQLSAQLSGCTDPLATNYNSTALVNNGSCTYTNVTLVPDPGIVLPAVMSETSGLVLFNDQLLTHNDDSDTNLYLIDYSDPVDFVTLPITGASNIDWEDVAEDEQYIYIGDFGNNVSGNRTNLRIFRILKSELMNNPVADTISFSYEAQTDFTPQSSNSTDFDCEAFIVTAGKIHLFTKEWGTKKTSVYELEKTPGTHVALYKGTLNVQGLITGATHLEEEQLVVLSGYSVILQPFVYLLYDFENDDFFSGNKRKIMLNLPYHQVEGITSEDGLMYYLSNEAFPTGNIQVDPKIMKLDLSSYLSNYLEGNPLAIKEPVANTFVQVFPNPAKEAMVIQLSEEQIGIITSVELIDGTGRTVLQQEINEQQTIISLNDAGTENEVVIVVFRNEQYEVVSTTKLRLK
ncbi:T9SS C-terminal target domain-containing protein [Crocinitomicaceae bacterium CZZ-1]|uniref:T9SS C-terminal target domain-containing protein n=1 Tax=Taishania pollutisoli TaxID=2766479 RepID=A0A8J6PKV7_9FLAO|nr:T9SS type A sorting domain-containing protein [Taishania pollutisoli]MBC9813484.1 T9SS C-terminal target domain-containing protein [Taishania pollutisoli]